MTHKDDMTLRWRVTKSNRGFNLWLTSPLIIISQNENIGSTLRKLSQFAVLSTCHSKDRRRPGPKS